MQRFFRGNTQSFFLAVNFVSFFLSSLGEDDGWCCTIQHNALHSTFNGGVPAHDTSYHYACARSLDNHLRASSRLWPMPAALELGQLQRADECHHHLHAPGAPRTRHGTAWALELLPSRPKPGSGQPSVCCSSCCMMQILIKPVRAGADNSIYLVPLGGY
jgi:hypothetical protein